MRYGKSAIAAAGEFELMFRSTKSFVSRKPIKIIQICKMLLKQTPSAPFLFSKHYRFLFLISEDDSINLLSVSKNVKYLKNGLDSLSKSLA